VRLKPGSAKGVPFITLEDETGVANLVIWPGLFEQKRRVVLGARMLGVEGQVQREGEVVHVVARRLHDLSGLLDSLGGETPRRTCRCRRDGAGEGRSGSETRLASRTITRSARAQRPRSPSGRVRVPDPERGADAAERRVHALLCRGQHGLGQDGTGLGLRDPPMLGGTACQKVTTTGCQRSQPRRP
jgi:hypothetical protein